MGISPQFLLIPIPDSEKNKEILNVRFSSKEKYLTPKIIEIRLLTNEPQ